MVRRFDKEKRRAVRRSIAVNGVVRTSNGQTRSCEIHDISQTGAMLFLADHAALPSEFVLEIPGNVVVRRRCWLVRQEGSTVGARFPDQA